jgi:regulator of RNase E activity RraA
MEQPGTDLFTRLEKLYTGLISDVLDSELGLRNNVCIMSHEIRPLYPGAVVAGRAVTALAVPVCSAPEIPYKKQMAMIDSLRPGDVAVLTQSGAMTASLWGGLLSAGAKQKGARGAVLDGITRDTGEIIHLNFPVFVRGIAPGNSKGRLDVIELNVPIICGGASVNPGDIIFGDNDGVVVIPHEIAMDIVRLAEERREKERLFKKALEKGGSLAEMFAEYRAL